jgi:hypothetical protein
MEKIVLFIFILLTSVDGRGQESALERQHQFSWLLGKWQKQDSRPGSEAFELWYEHPDGHLEGLGYALRQGDTTFVENLSIIEQDGAFYYVADVSHNASPTYFRITQMSDSAFTSANPEHDFPQRISYTLVGDELTATISDDERVIPFVFLRVEE